MVSATKIEINGGSPTAEQVHTALVFNYGHFTSMQVRDGAVPGLGLHLRRLVDSSRELFGTAVDPERVRSLLRHAIADAAPAVSARINVFSTDSAARSSREPDVMVTLSPPASDAVDPPWRVRTVAYERDLAHLKHVGFFGVLHQRQRAHAAGYDDPLFVDHAGRVSEGATWNLCLFDGDAFIFPEADLLTGVTMQLLRAGLNHHSIPHGIRPVTVAELSGFRAAFASNSSHATQPIGSINEIPLPGSERGNQLLTAAWRQVEPELI